MNETSEMWQEHNGEKQKARVVRRASAGQEFSRLKVEAMQVGIAVKQHTDVHYQIAYGRANWLWNVYPGNRRIYVDEAHQAAGTPRLDLPANWTLKDAVRAAIALRKELTGR